MILLLVAGVIAVLVIISITGNNLVFYSDEYAETKSVSKGGSVYPFKEMFSGEGQWDAFLIRVCILMPLQPGDKTDNRVGCYDSAYFTARQRLTYGNYSYNQYISSIPNAPLP